jgi:hypothetical protein
MPQVWISFSAKAVKTWGLFEAQTPQPEGRLDLLKHLPRTTGLEYFRPGTNLKENTSHG